MAIGYNPRIVTDGLVFCVDFANTKSYTSGISTTTVYDIGPDRTSGDITSAPTFSSDKGGYLDFDGTDDFVNFRVSLNGPDLSLQTITVSAWVNFDTATWVMGNGAQFRIRLNGTAISWWIREELDGGSNELSSPASTMTTGEWGNIVGTYDGTNQKIYHNGLEVASTNPGLGLLDEGTNNLALGQSFATSGNFLNGKLAMTTIYNRALTAEEIQQNFNAGRERFGI